MELEPMLVPFMAQALWLTLQLIRRRLSRRTLSVRDLNVFRFLRRPLALPLTARLSERTPEPRASTGKLRGAPRPLCSVAAPTSPTTQPSPPLLSGWSSLTLTLMSCAHQWWTISSDATTLPAHLWLQCITHSSAFRPGSQHGFLECRLRDALPVSQSQEAATPTNSASPPPPPQA